MNDLILILVIVIPTVLASVWWALRPRAVTKKLSVQQNIPTIMFKNGIIEHASDAALAQFPIAIGMHDWSDLYEILKLDFPEFPKTPMPQNSDDTIVDGGCSQTQKVEIKWRANTTIVAFTTAETFTRDIADFEELDTLRQINSNSPHPVWKTDKSGAVIWKNTAYGKLACDIHENSMPSKSIFDLPENLNNHSTSRVEITPTDGAQPEFFEVSHTFLDDGVLHQATSMSALIKAEDAQREFVQTLAKTFAHLSIGLAIFNRDRQLALFNPALADLTGLPVSFLSPRPTLGSFFDALRENRRMPEPKNYRTWRQRLADLVSAAESGKFEETWTLETGQTYIVKGRPHPDGAIAFLFEDISAEVSLTRNFRAELEMGQSLADTFEDALAVFSQSGILTFSNKAYDHLWGFGFDTSFADVTIFDAVRMWKEKSAKNPKWDDLQHSVMTLGERVEWSMPIHINDKPPMTCKIVPIASGATVIRFSQKAEMTPKKVPVFDSVNY